MKHTKRTSKIQQLLILLGAVVLFLFFLHSTSGPSSSKNDRLNRGGGGGGAQSGLKKIDSDFDSMADKLNEQLRRKTKLFAVPTPRRKEKQPEHESDDNEAVNPQGEQKLQPSKHRKEREDENDSAGDEDKSASSKRKHHQPKKPKHSEKYEAEEEESVDAVKVKEQISTKKGPSSEESSPHEEDEVIRTKAPARKEQQKATKRPIIKQEHEEAVDEEPTLAPTKLKTTKYSDHSPSDDADVETTPIPTKMKSNAKPPSEKVKEEPEAPKRFRGIDLDNRDKQTHSNPGGTEAEALAIRRKLSKKNLKVTSWDQYLWHDGEKLAAPSGLARIRTQLSPNVSLQYETAATVCGPTDFDCLLKEYPEDASSDESCRATYSYDLIKKFRKGETKMCTSAKKDVRAEVEAPAPFDTEITCRMAKTHHDNNVATANCRFNNFAINFDQIQDGDYPWLAFQQGALETTCKKTSAGKRHWEFMHCQADWMNLGLQEGQGKSPKIECDETMNGPVYLETRSGDYSPFAVTHDWLNTMIQLAAFGVDAKKVRTLIMDRMTVGFYTPVWQHAFSAAGPLMWFPDLRKQYNGKTLCIKEAYINIPARLSPLYNQDNCKGSTILSLYRDYVLHQFHALRTVADPKVLVVTVIVRRNYNTGHSIGRRFGNLEKLTARMRNTMGDDVVVNQVDFADMDFDHQLNVSRSSDLLVAIHGAGLIHLMFQHSFAGAFEFFCPEKPSSNYRYQQLSMRMNRHYDSFSIENNDNIVPLDEAMPKLIKLAEKVRKEKKAFFARGGEETS